MRLAALGLYHEANTFVSERVDRHIMEAAGIARGPEEFTKYRGGTATMSGYLAVGDRPDVEVVPLMMTTLVPSGIITAEALQSQVDELVTALKENGPFDGVLAALHGAAVAEGCADVDGYLLRAFRDVVGRDVPIGVSLDLHANISEEICRQADIVNTYRTNPHLDAKERAEEVADLVIRTVRGEVRPTLAFRPVPAAVNILRHNTSEAPLDQIMARVEEVLRRPGVLAATVAVGYPYADVPEMGMSVVVVTDADQSSADHCADDLVEFVWSRREGFDATAFSVDAAVQKVLAAERGPILLLDVGDNVLGGSAGDSVVVLAGAREAGLESLFTMIADPAAVAVCDEAGVGSEVHLRIGGTSHPEIGPPLEARATVLGMYDAVHEASGDVHAGMRHFDGGRSALVRLGTGQTVVLTSRVLLPLSAENLTMFGLEPGQFKAIVAKGTHSPLPGYASSVAEAVHVDTPGTTTADLRRFTYRNRRRPLYPLEQDGFVVPEARPAPVSDLEVDLVVVGGGGSGLAAAVQAAQLGARVALLEKSDDLGGTTARSVGSITASCTRVQRAAGIDDSVEDHFEDLGTAAGDRADRDNLGLRRLYVQNCADTLHWLMSLGIQFSDPMPEPPNRRPRMHNVLPNAAAYVYHLRRAAIAHGVEIRTGVTVRSLRQDGWRVDGVRAVTAAGRELEVSARRGVVLAAGDFSSSTAMKVQYLGESLARVDGVVASSSGDGIRLGLEAGGRVVNADLALGPELRFVAPTRRPLVQSLPPNRLLTSVIRQAMRWAPPRLLRPFVMSFATSYLAPSATVFDRGGILVNLDGRRFTDERATPWLDLPGQPNGAGFIVLDSTTADQLREWPNFVSTAPGVAYAFIDDYRRNRKDIFHSAATVEQLATAIGVPADVLTATVAAWNATANPPLSRPPYIALGPVRSWIVLTEGGLAVNEDMQVLDTADSPVEGLYAAGSTGQGGLILPGHGTHLGWAFTSGRIAARSAVVSGQRTRDEKGTNR